MQEVIESAEQNTDNLETLTQNELKTDAQADPSGNIRKRKVIKEVAYYVCLIIALLVINKLVIVNAYIPSGSMEKTIMTGDYVVGNRLMKKHINRYDIIIFEGEDGRYLIKRVIGLPGETIEIKDGKVYADGKELEDSFTQGRTTDEGVYECDGYFVMGDNRENSYDSRFWEKTCVDPDEVVAKAWLRIWKGFKIFKHIPD